MEDPEEEVEEEEDVERLEELRTEFKATPRSHFSTWSSDSIAYSCPTSEDDDGQSPTFSSLTSNCSDLDSPQQFSIPYSYTEQTDDNSRTPTILEPEVDDDDDDDDEANTTTTTTYLSATPPQLDALRISTFGSTDLFNLDIQHVDTAPRRQAACFGLGFYSLPDDETTSKTTIIASDDAAALLRSSTDGEEPTTINVQRESSMSQLNRLMDEFAFLGDAVI